MEKKLKRTLVINEHKNPPNNPVICKGSPQVPSVCWDFFLKKYFSSLEWKTELNWRSDGLRE